MLYDSRIEKEGYDEVLDFRMSQEFGLDWKQHEWTRMKYFIELKGLDFKRQELENKKNSS